VKKHTVTLQWKLRVWGRTWLHVT